MQPRDDVVEALDAFDLPEWLGTGPVTWAAGSSVRGARWVTGTLRGGGDSPVDGRGDGTGDGRGDGSGDGDELGCDLLAADVAHPRPLLPDTWRRRAHQAWEHGEVLLVSYDGRLTLAVPGTAYSADGVLETVGRLARALGVQPAAFTVCLRL